MPLDRVVYVLGAGFSAPLGVPVMSNFLVKSKDMYFDDPGRYGYFEKVLDRIQRMSIVKNYYRADLFNIEEILSISEMSSFVHGHQFRNEFIQYIKDVIEYYTPDIQHYGQLPSNWQGFAFGNDQRWTAYGYFVTNLCNVRLGTAETKQGTVYTCSRNDDIKAHYAVVSLNYDLVLEKVCAFVNKHFRMDAPMGFCGGDADGDGTILAKLHGSLDVGAIVPPTWSKGSHPEIVPAWRRALEELRAANHIRFIGYSLPAADAYVRYLLKAAAIDAPHLKTVDVICWDPTGSARAQYDEFITFANYRFVSGKTQDYLKVLSDLTLGREHRFGHPWRRLEKSHEAFMQEPGAA
jgi:hypothetical protein